MHAWPLRVAVGCSVCVMCMCLYGCALACVCVGLRLLVRNGVEVTTIVQGAEDIAYADDDDVEFIGAVMLQCHGVSRQL